MYLSINSNAIRPLSVRQIKSESPDLGWIDDKQSAERAKGLVLVARISEPW